MYRLSMLKRCKNYNSFVVKLQQNTIYVSNICALFPFLKVKNVQFDSVSTSVGFVLQKGKV